MVVRTPHFEYVRAFEAKDDSILIVYTDGVPAAQVPAQSVQAIAGGHLQVIEPDDGVDLIQLPPDDGPEIARDAPGGLRVLRSSKSGTGVPCGQGWLGGRDAIRNWFVSGVTPSKRNHQ